MQAQLTALLRNVPVIIDWNPAVAVAADLRVCSRRKGIAIDIDGVKDALRNHWQEVGSFAKNLLVHLGRSGQLVVGWLTLILLVPVVTFYLLRDWDILVASVHDLLPRIRRTDRRHAQPGESTRCSQSSCAASSP